VAMNGESRVWVLPRGGVLMAPFEAGASDRVLVRWQVVCNPFRKEVSVKRV